MDGVSARTRGRRFLPGEPVVERARPALDAVVVGNLVVHIAESRRGQKAVGCPPNRGPTGNRLRSVRRVVVAVGNGKVSDDGNLRPLDVHKGDRILFGKYSGTEIQLEGEEHLIIREDDVLAVLE